MGNLGISYENLPQKMIGFLRLFLSRPTLGPPGEKGKVGRAHPGPPSSGVPGYPVMVRLDYDD